MSSISSISSILSSLLLESSSTLSADDSETTTSSSTDTVSLSSESLKMLETLLNSLNEDSTDSDDDSSDSIYDILISAQNKKLIQENPTLVNMIISSGGSETSDIDLVNMSATNILSIIEEYETLSSSTSTDTTSSEVDETV